MYGLVNVAIEELVCSKAGLDKWIEIKKRAGVTVDKFSRLSSYPDKMTYDLVGAVSHVLDMPPDAVMRAFGEFWVLYTGQNGYGHLFGIAGNSLPDFLNNLDNLHTRIGLNFPALQPPSFMCEEEPDGKYRLHYYSDRPGLCPMVVGLVDGLAQHFKVKVAIEHPLCRRDAEQRQGQGAEAEPEIDHCEFLLTITPHG